MPRGRFQAGGMVSLNSFTLRVRDLHLPGNRASTTVRQKVGSDEEAGANPD
jgi:hypothetical protein